MNINTIKKALPFCFNNKIVPLLIGQHGVGKSSGVLQYTQENNVGFIDLRLGQMETGDLLGLPDITVDSNGQKTTVFARPKWFPTEGKGVLFLDEINRAKRDVLQAIFQLVLDRKIHDYTLPEGWHVVAAQNPNTGDYMVTEFDKALNDRFCHIKVTSSYQDFIEYGSSKGLNKGVLSFISAHPGMLRGATEDFNLNYVTPSDRSMEIASRLVDDKNIPEDILNELLNGLIGLEASTAFMAWKRTAEKPIDGALVLSNYKKVRKEIQAQCDAKNYRPDLVNDTKQQVLKLLGEMKADEKPDKKIYNNIKEFMKDLPNDLFVDMVKQLFKVPNKMFIDLASEENTDAEFNAKLDQCLLEAQAKKTEEATNAEKKEKKA